MITRNTVFVLGAGASQPYHYPSGTGLVDIIVEKLKPNGELRNLCSALNYRDDYIDRFYQELHLANPHSIDSFIEGNEKKYDDIGRILIGLTLLSYEIGDDLLVNGEGKWYREFLNKIKTPKGRDFMPPVSFLTFNYDRSFDHYLYQSIKAHYSFDDSYCKTVMGGMPIVHLHGHLGKLPWQAKANSGDSGREYKSTFKELELIKEVMDRGGDPLSSHEQIQFAEAKHYIKNKLCGNIKFIHDNNADDEEFRNAYRLLNEAERIYFLGFGYNKDNLRRLQIADLPDEIKVEGITGESKTDRIIKGTAHGIGNMDKKKIKNITNGKVELFDYDALKFIDEEVEFD